MLHQMRVYQPPDVWGTKVILSSRVARPDIPTALASCQSHVEGLQVIRHPSIHFLWQGLCCGTAQVLRRPAVVGAHHDGHPRGLPQAHTRGAGRAQAGAQWVQGRRVLLRRPCQRLDEGQCNAVRTPTFTALHVPMHKRSCTCMVLGTLQKQGLQQWKEHADP